VTPPQHSCTLPSSAEEYWEVAAAFIAEGVAAGERIIYLDDDTSGPVLERLEDDELAPAELMARGQLVVLPQEMTRMMLSEPPEAVRRRLRSSIDIALGKGYPGWRLTGETSWGLVRAGGYGSADYDAALDAELIGRPAKALCFYADSRYTEAQQTQLRAIHEHERASPSVYDDGLLRITRVGPGMARLAGEADHSSEGTLDRLLDSVLHEAVHAHTAPTTITIDIASLRFLDVAGAVTLVRAMERFPSTHRLVLRGVRPRVQRVLSCCGAESAPQLDVLVRDRSAEADTVPQILRGGAGPSRRTG